MLYLVGYVSNSRITAGIMRTKTAFNNRSHENRILL